MLSEHGVTRHRTPAVTGRHVVNGNAALKLPLQPYRQQTGSNANTSNCETINGPHGGVERAAEPLCPAAKV